MVRQIIDNQDDKAIETLARTAVKDDMTEFKALFKEKYDHDWETIKEAFSDEDNKDGISAAEKFLENLFAENRKKIDQNN